MKNNHFYKKKRYRKYNNSIMNKKYKILNLSLKIKAKKNIFKIWSNNSRP